MCHFAGVKYMSKLEADDIIFASFNNHVFEVSTIFLFKDKVRFRAHPTMNVYTITVKAIDALTMQNTMTTEQLNTIFKIRIKKTQVEFGILPR